MSYRINRRPKKQFSSSDPHCCYSKTEFEALVRENVPLFDVLEEISINLKKFQATLQGTEICKDSIEVVISLLLKVSKGLADDDDDDMRSKSINILSEVLSDRCNKFHSQLKVFVGGSDLFLKYTIKNANMVHDLFGILLRRLPDASWRLLPLEQSLETIQLLSENGALDSDTQILEKMKNLAELKQKKKDEHSVKMAEAKSAASASKRTWDNSEYRALQILPRWEEISKPERPYRLRPNLVDESYDDWMHYFDVQFRLLREDFISPLRDGISDYLGGKVGRQIRNVKVYQRVTIERPVFARAGLCHEIKFDVFPFRGYRWEHSKRLIFGSLLCLSPDHFQKNIYFAVVSNRDPRRLQRGYFEVMFQGGADLLAHMKLKREFVMVESLAYFEASRHILRSLQEAEAIEPFTRYLISNDCSNVKLPQYVNSGESTSCYDLQFIVKKTPKCMRTFTNVPIADHSRWPTVGKTDLDESQLKAIKMALTQEIAVIQGPPGTGKTYIGLKIVQALLKNRKIWNAPIPALDFLRPLTLQSPILVMCYTNHALDQFLEGILAMNEDIRMIRIGGRSKNEKIQECSLSNVKRRLRNIPKEEYVTMKSLFTAAEKEGQKCHFEMLNYYDPENKYLPLSNLRCVIEDHHYWSLIESAETKEEEERALDLWLGLCRKEVMVEYETIKLPAARRQKDPSPQNEDESSSEYESDSDSSESQSSDNEEPEEEELMDTVDIAGEANMEEDARMVDEVSEMFEEMKFGEHENTSADRNSPGEEETIQVETNRIVNIVNVHHAYELKKIILKQQEMCEEEVSEVHNVNDLQNIRDRYRLYKYWHCKYRAHLLKELEEKCQRFNRLCEEADRVRKFNDRYALDTADVIGMTTTGAAKYQHVLEIVKPKIVIVEEAAEVLESHIVSALNTGTQHLILIGDHKQLRPNPNDYELAIKYKLEISLFERLVMNGFPHVTLEIQHRMRPIIADLVRGNIYDTLFDHDSVKNYPSIKGVEKNLFFIHHSQPEKPSDLSHSNEHEAEYLAALCKFLLQQGYEPSQITILVTYTGQLLLIKKFMPRNTFEGVRVTTVDNFQGEENDIILLSLVRSNDRDSIGFLKAENRVCVALSRAKHGFYCIGNFLMLRKNAAVWDHIVSEMISKNSIDGGLNVHCNNHPEYKFTIRQPKDFTKYLPTGGCTRPCQYRLSCGHACDRTCHSDDPNHEKNKCKKPCNNICKTCGQACQLKCHQECKCTARVLKVIPGCNHTQEMFCYEDPSIVNCREPCIRKLYCGHEQMMQCSQDPYYVNCRRKCEKKCPYGHPCPLLCSQPCLCKVTSTVKLPTCGHEQEVCCYQMRNLSSVLCQAQCNKTCSFNHPCTKKCSEDCGECKVTVSQKLSCGHTVQTRCSERLSVKCNKVVEVPLACSHAVKIRCHERSTVKCNKTVNKILKCNHIVRVKCSESSIAKCNMPCDKKLYCGHKCKSLCGEPCSKFSGCQELVKVALPKCKHIVQIPCHEKTLCSYLKWSFQCTNQCDKKLSCGHKCTNLCGQPCTTECQVNGIKHTCPRGRHTVIRKCFQNFQRYPCTENCTRILSCSHPCQNPCSEPCTNKCQFRVPRTYPCGHKRLLECSTPIEDEPCDSYCRTPLACGHLCRGKCSDCWRTRIHKPCDYHTLQAHHCGETIKMSCVGLEDCHLKIAPNKILHCAHESVPYLCNKEPQKCKMPCEWRCPHYACTKLCHEHCNRPPCNKRCPKMLECAHPCPGICGDECFTLCPECDGTEFRKLLKSPGDYSAAGTYCQLPCGHIFTSQDMDKHTDVSQAKDVSVGPLQCPACSALLSCSFRYGNRMKQSLAVVDAAKQKMATLSRSQAQLSPVMAYKLKRICRLAVAESYRKIRGEDILLTSLKNLQVFSGSISLSEGFFQVLLARLLVLATQSTESFQVCQQMLTSLVGFIDGKQPLSFQTIHDLYSEVYRLWVTVKLQLIKQDDIFGPIILEKSKHPHSRITRQEFLSFSWILNTKETSLCATLQKSCEVFTRDIEDFTPIVLRGSWQRCNRDHYYCIPVCEPGSLRMQCPECTGNYLDSISIVQRSTKAEVDIQKQTTQVLAAVKSRKKAKSEAAPQQGEKKKKKKKKKK